METKKTASSSWHKTRCDFIFLKSLAQAFIVTTDALNVDAVLPLPRADHPFLTYTATPTYAQQGLPTTRNFYSNTFSLININRH